MLNLTTKSRITLYLSGSVFSGYGCIPGEGLKRNGRRGALSLAVNIHPVKLNPPNAPAFAGVFRLPLSDQLVPGFGFTGSLPNCAPAPFRSDFLTNFFLTSILLTSCFFSFHVRPRCRCRTLASCCRRRGRSCNHSASLKKIFPRRHRRCVTRQCYNGAARTGQGAD